MKPLLALLFLCLVACASPAPEFIGATRQDVTLYGYRFAVFQKGDRAEVVRLGYLTWAERRDVPGLMVRAVEQATGCHVRPDSVVTGLPGDSGEARMRLSCAKASA